MGSLSDALAQIKPAGESATHIQARLSREEYDDYLQRFRPIEDQYASEIFNPTLSQARVGRADQFVTQGFNQARQSNARNLGRYGLSFNPAQQRTYDRESARNETLSRINAKNQTRQLNEERDLGHLLSLVNYGRDLASGASRIRADLANKQVDRDITNRQLDQQERANRNQALATAATLAVAI